MELVFLPPNTTSRLQPVDAELIAAMKMQYRKFHLERALDLLDESEKHVYAVDMLTAVRAMNKVWEDLQPEIIHSCWVHTKLLEWPVVPTTKSTLLSVGET